MSKADTFRLLPKVDALLAHEAFGPLLAEHGRSLVLGVLRDDLDHARASIAQGALADAAPDEVEAHVAPAAVAARVAARLAAGAAPTYARALNATGVVLHTGLGRAPLAEEAQAALAAASGYTVLEVERESGKRGQRDTGITALVRELTGAEAACVVNNNAGATLIALAALAHDRPVIVSRGQLVEIGGSYRIPDVMAQSGAHMIEVGTTNRTHLRDYERALKEHPETALLLRVHCSNFRVVGFTREVELADLVGLAKRHPGLEVMDDLGSGCLVDLSPYGLPSEPLVGDSLTAGAGVVTFSGDKLLGGPQAGIVVGTQQLVTRVRKHPLYRALRPDKLVLAALEATLHLYRQPERVAARVPVVRLIATPLAELERQAEDLARELTALDRGLDVRVEPATSRIGGGSYAVEELETRVVSLTCAELPVEELARRLRLGTPAVYARIHDDRLTFDPRTLLPGQPTELVQSVARALD